MVKDFKSGANNAGSRKDFRQGGGNAGGRGGFNKGGNFRGGNNRGQDQGPPERVEPVCVFSHTCGEQIVVKATDIKKVPKFNRGIYLENKTKVGTVDEILGPIDGFFYSIKLVEGVSADSYKPGDKFYMGWDDTLPIDRFLPKPKGAGGPRRGGPGGFQKGGPGGRGGFQKGGFNNNNKGGFNKGGFNKGGFNKGGNAGGFKKNFKN
ncbi:hypothetical protein ABPG72_019089 [Tetrahymena utriculariae]